METNNAYKLKHNLDHIKNNYDFDVWQVIQDRQEKTRLHTKLEPISNFPPLRFEGKVEKRLSWLDYPHEKSGYPIMSKKIVNVLTSVGQFKHQAIPIEIHDWKSDQKTDDFIFLHLLECIDVLDQEKTDFYEAPLSVLKKSVTRAALKMPNEGYPPLFRVKDAGLTRFVSKEAREAIETADLKGIHFVRLISS
jgi:hypothetical protein